MDKQQKKKDEYDQRKAVIIGESFTRLLDPLSSDMPLLLLPLCGIPIVEYMLDSLFTANVKEIIICVKSHGEELKKYFKETHNLSTKIRCIISEEFNSVGDCLRKVHNENLISEDFILIRGLSITNVNLEKAYNYHLEKKKKEKSAMMTILMKEYKNNIYIKTDYDNSVIIFSEETKKIYLYESIYQLNKVTLNEMINFSTVVRSDLFEANIEICSPEVLSVFTENFDYHNIRDDFFKNRIITDNFFFYELNKDIFLGLIRNPESYLKVSSEIINRWDYPVVLEDSFASSKLHINYRMMSYSIYNDKNNKEENFSKAKLIRSVVLSENCVIGDGTQLRFSVIGKGVTIGKNCILDNCIILEGCSIGDNVRIYNSIISKQCNIDNNIIIKNGILGREVEIKENIENERVYWTSEDDEEEKEKFIEKMEKELFYKNLEDREVMFLPNKGFDNEGGEEEEEEEDEFEGDNEEEEEIDNQSEEEEDYQNELESVINSGIEKEGLIEDMMKEISSLKNAYFEKTYSETVKACLVPILGHFMKGENFSQMHIPQLKKLFTEWKGLFKRMVPNDQEEVYLIAVIEQLCSEMREISEAFHIIVQILNSTELEIIKDDAIREWNKNEESAYPTSETRIVIPDDVHRKNKEKMQKYIEANIIN